MINASVNYPFGSRAFVCDTKPWFCVAGGEGLAPPRLRRKTKILLNVNLVCAVVDDCVVGMVVLAPPVQRRKTMVLYRKQEGHVWRVSQQTLLLCETAAMSASSHSRHVYCVTQQTLSAVSHSSHVCCVTQQTCLLCPSRLATQNHGFVSQQGRG